jgi:hypothetical protein
VAKSVSAISWVAEALTKQDEEAGMILEEGVL